MKLVIRARTGPMHPAHFTLLFVVAVSLAAGCASQVYNVPFINTDETLQLRFNMTMPEVQAALGTPYYVRSGGDEMIEWIYVVRTEVVKSHDYGEPAKNSDLKRDDSSVHRLAVNFRDGKLVSWAPLAETAEVVK